MSQTAPPKRPSSAGPRREASGIGDPLEVAALLDGPLKSNAYDALTDLFLGEPAGPAPSRRPQPGLGLRPLATPTDRLSAATPGVEGLILGHLPVLASAWATQYARQRSVMAGGPVVLLRIRAGEAVLDLIGGEPAESPDTAESLEDAIRLAAPHARAWLIRVDETSEPRLTEQWGVDTVTLLTGVDEAAVVASYRTMKQLFRPSDDEPAGPEARLAIMGATPERAVEAAAKLERAAQAFLGRHVVVTACISRIGGGRLATLYRGPAGGSTEDVLKRVVPLIRSMPRPAAGGSQRLGPAAPPDLDPDTIPLEPPSMPAATVSRFGHAGVGSADQGSPGPLAGHLRGLTPLRAACPYTPQVELAADSGGSLHLLSRMTTGFSQNEAVSHLVTAAAWAGSHLSLLRLAAQAEGARLDSQDRPVLHLLTSDPRAVRRLGDADVRLHLLARVEVAGQAGWYCTDLN